jgi:hypothetical protein
MFGMTVAVLGLIGPPTTLVTEQTEPAHLVSVEYTPPMVLVRITRPASLDLAFTALCEKTHLRCDVTPEASRTFVAAPLELQGTVPEVVVRLLESSGLSFAMTWSRGSLAGVLIVEPSGSAANRTDEARHAATAPGTSKHSTFPSTAPSVNEVAPDKVEGEATADDAAGASVEPPASGAEADRAFVGGLAVTIIGATPQAAPGEGSLTVLPFSDRTGRPLAAVAVPAAEATHNVLPFLDEQGQPIVMPVTNEPVTVTPFLGPDGQPFVVPPGTPGLKVTYPIPGMPKGSGRN